MKYINNYIRMKNLHVIAAALFITLSSSFQCGKNNDASPNEISKGRNALSMSESGKWEMRESRGDRPLVKFEPANGNILKFDGSKYEIYENNVLKKSGTYMIEADNTAEQNICLSNATNLFKHRILFDNERKFNQFVTMPDSLKPPVVTTVELGKVFIGVNKTADTLSLASGCFVTDGGMIIKYVKIP